MPATSPLTFQSLILRLQSFWAAQGCVIWQPHHTEVGAGTDSPATALRVLGPEPWRVAYVEPSIRPADGRYGENPNRWQHYYQFQVILKPEPGNPQELFLQSLEELGIDLSQHDVRFVEDNWEAPALGAWGLGWEVWLDGQEITQFTYFQQAGGQALDPVSCEITYGLERIAVALQGVESFVDLKWSDSTTYGELLLRAEEEFSRYNFDHASVDRMRTLFETFEAEAVSAIEAGLVFPAHDYVLKCSHTFNLLDARGVVGVMERAQLFGRMRELSLRVAEAYLAQREAMGFPWLEPRAEPGPAGEEPELGPAVTRPEPFLLEIGTEELPADDLAAALEQLEERVGKVLDALRLEHGEVRVMGTPRRLVVSIEDLAPTQAEAESLVRGPPAERAFDSSGAPTAAAQGFARSRGIQVSELQVQEVDGGRYVVAQVRQIGLPTDQVLPEALVGLIEGLRFKKTMRWNASGAAFSRPVRWIVALHGKRLVPFSFAGVRSGRTTRGLRAGPESALALKSAADYFEKLEASGILLDPEARRESVWRQVEQLASAAGGEPLADQSLLTEVANLVEAPVAFSGRFEEKYLELPRPVLIEVMRVHQRYFPVLRADELLPSFLAVGNGSDDELGQVAMGNEQVIRARFADADYFIRKDLEQPLESYVPSLATLTFQTELGSMLDKVGRIERLVGELAKDLGLGKEDKAHALRAARLSKADLTTQMVIEMTSLQGEMGRLYALRSGEPEAVAKAIFEHYLPRTGDDQIPATRPGLAVGVADRLDTLMGLFAVGLQPSGSGDPYGLRRAAIGLVQSLIGHDLAFDLRRGLLAAAEGLPVETDRAAIEACIQFIAARQQQALLAEGRRYDVVEAVLAEVGHDPARASRAAAALEGWTQRENWPEVLQAYARCARITRDQEAHEVDPDRLEEPSEKRLFQEVQKALSRDRAPGSVEDFFAAFVPLVSAITAFFDDVLVMAEDEALRENRVGLLQQIVGMARGVADLSKLEGF